MKVLFISPHYPPEMSEFTRGLAEVGATIFGVSDAPYEAQPESVRRHLSGFAQVSNLTTDEKGAAAQIIAATRGIQFDRIETLWEPCVLLAARLREMLGVPGMSRSTCVLFRDKPLMKEALRRAGLRVPRSGRVRNVNDVWKVAEYTGFPLIIKPVAGAGSNHTFPASSPQELQSILPRIGHLDEAVVEEYIRGDEFTYDTVSIDGTPAFESVNQYLVRPLESCTNEWISPSQIVLRDPHIPHVAPGVTLGRNVLKVLGMGTGFTHMEWFLTPEGEAVFGEIACRSPGGSLVEQMNYCNDFDIYREYGRAVCWKSFEAPITRRYHSGMVFKRAIGRGRITRVEGRRRVHEQYGQWIVKDNLKKVGSTRANWKQSIMGDGCISVRHPDYDTCKRMVDDIVMGVKLYAS